MINQRFRSISKNDIEALIANGVQKGKTIEYKEKISINSDWDKKEFLADISSFANASGGDIIYGIRERRDRNRQPTGIPACIIGLDDINLDFEIQRLKEIIRSGISPRIIGLQIKAINIENKPLILIRIPKSWNSPHMVTLKGLSRFYARNNAGRYRLEIDELRSAFIASDSLADRLRNFRSDRLAQILANETPVRLSMGPKVVLHLIPVESFISNKLVNINLIKEKIKVLNSSYCTECLSRYNFDGAVSYIKVVGRDIYLGYTQIFRNGVIEGVDTLLSSFIGREEEFCIDELEKILINALDNYLDTQNYLDLNPPIFVMVSLIDVAGFYIRYGNISKHLCETLHSIDRDHLIITEKIVEDLSAKSSEILQPIFDDIWRACGWERSFNYDKEGNWSIDRKSQ